MILENRATEIRLWHTHNGGFCKAHNFAPHALRLLEEVIELCVASGAQLNDIFFRSNGAIDKEFKKHGKLVIAAPENMKEEFADVQFLLFILAGFAGVDINVECINKYEILLERKWEVDKDGVLRRPR